MDPSQSALDSLRTVEFRETLKGYHRDDVDEYLEKAAVEAEGLQEQHRQLSERLRQASERIAQLEEAIEARPEPSTASADALLQDDTLQRTFVAAQQFVDQMKADAEARAKQLVSEAEANAQGLTTEAETTAAQIAAEAEGKLRTEIERLESIRMQLAGDIETLARHLEGERSRLRTSLAEVIKWVDENVKTASALAGQRSAEQRTGAAGQPQGQPSGTARPQSATTGAAAEPANGGATAAVGATPMRPTGAVRPAAGAGSLPLQA